MNILTTNGLVGRYVTDWAGVDARITNVSIKLGTPNLPGDTMTLTGEVKNKDEEAGSVEVEIAGKTILEEGTLAYHEALQAQFSILEDMKMAVDCLPAV